MKPFNIPSLDRDRDVKHWDKTNELVDELNSLELKEGTEKGTISVTTKKGTENVLVHGLSGMAFDNPDDYQKKINGADGEVFYFRRDEGNKSIASPEYIVGESWICNSQEDLDLCFNHKPSFKDVFDNWERFRIYKGINYKDKDDLIALGVLSANSECRKPIWTYDESRHTVCQQSNSTEYVGFVSPKKYENYDITVRLYSTDSDDDSIGLIGAYYLDINGKPHSLSFIRSCGNTGSTWACVVDYSTFSIDNNNGQIVLANSSYKAPNPVTGTKNPTFSLAVYEDAEKKVRAKTSENTDAVLNFTYGWTSNSTSNALSFMPTDYQNDYYKITSGTYEGKYAHGLQAHYVSGDIESWDMRQGTVVRIIREGNKFTAYCSQFGSVEIDPNTKIVIDLDLLSDTYPILNNFKQALPWGYSNFSQAYSMYENIKITDTAGSIYDTVNWDVWKYENENWHRTGLDPLEEFGRGRIAYNNITNKLFYSNINNFTHLSVNADNVKANLQISLSGSGNGISNVALDEDTLFVTKSNFLTGIKESGTGNGLVSASVSNGILTLNKGNFLTAIGTIIAAAGGPTQPVYISGPNTAKACTIAANGGTGLLSIVSQNLTNVKGYMLFSNGWQLCWGYEAKGARGTLARAFKSTDWIGIAAGGGNQDNSKMLNKTVSQFTMAENPAYYIAFGIGAD